MYKSKFYNYKYVMSSDKVNNMTKLHVQMESYINMTRENHEIQKVVYYRLKKYKK